MSVWDKLDSGLASIYANYLHVRERGEANVGHIHSVVAGDGRLNVLLRYTGDLARIEDLGFETLWTEGEGRAAGTINLANLERLAADPGVQKLTYGRPRKPRLDQSIPDIRANQVWSVSNGTFSGQTGAGVIVGIIDTGIDVKHPFLRTTSPVHETRILRIWDPGLVPQAGESSPDPSLLDAGGKTYGVEYKKADIMAGIGNAGSFRHRDCDGHGTHVASIAAGNGQDKFKYIGVAPEADLIVVKYLYLQQDPVLNGAPVGPSALLYHAVSYILNVAKNVFNRPVVINCSFGEDVGPHDGFTDEEDFLTDKFQAAVGQAIVFAAGNEAGSQQHAALKFPAGGGHVDVPIELVDKRTNRIEFSRCKDEDLTHELAIDLYYPSGGASLSIEMQLPLTTNFIQGPALNDPNPVQADYQGKRHYSMIHKADNIDLRKGRGTVNRNHFYLEVQPDSNHQHATGTYTLRITASDALEAHLWCDQADYGFVISGPGSDPTIVSLEDRFLIAGDSGGANVISVAAYNAEESDLPLSSFSSRGPLANYGGAPAQPSKPDLAAPGEHVDAAKSRDSKPKMKKTETVAMDGTSMAAPHVAGTIALLLEKDPHLTIDQIISTLKNFARPLEAFEFPEELGAGRLDAKSAFDNAP